MHLNMNTVDLQSPTFFGTSWVSSSRSRCIGSSCVLRIGP